LQAAGEIVSSLFIKIFRLISLPIISLSIIVTVSSLAGGESGRKLWQRTLLYTIGTTIVAATVSCLLYLLIKPGNVNLSSAISAAMPDGTQVNYTQFISNLVPANIFSPFLEQQIISVLGMSIAAGIAIRYITDTDAKESAINLFRGLHGIFLVITHWIIRILPIALFGFIASTITQIRQGADISGIAKFLFIIVAANLIQGFVILPLWLKLNKLKPYQVMRKMLPALIVAFFSKSSAGTLPVTINTAENRLGINSKISRFVLPLCTSINMNGCAAFIFVTVIYLMQNHGVNISFSTMALWIIVSTIAAIGNAGVPMGCFFLSASLLTSMNIPITLLGIILPFYTLIDMVETALNVWSDACVTAVVNDKAQRDAELEAPLAFPKATL
jgi:Na+/H+-dicarboxylate symporter